MLKLALVSFVNSLQKGISIHVAAILIEGAWLKWSCLARDFVDVWLPSCNRFLWFTDF